GAAARPDEPRGGGCRGPAPLPRVRGPRGRGAAPAAAAPPPPPRVRRRALDAGVVHHFPDAPGGPALHDQRPGEPLRFPGAHPRRGGVPREGLGRLQLPRPRRLAAGQRALRRGAGAAPARQGRWRDAELGERHP
ncbi:unnamed protein product, partial [Prorocentrum cordatum]